MADAQEQGLAILPGFLRGGRVERSGLALVHQGEYIMPADGSEAEISLDAWGGSSQVINYYFPVEVEVVGRLDAAQMQAVADFVFDQLNSALGARV
jgi:hypothetical protein